MWLACMSLSLYESHSASFFTRYKHEAEWLGGLDGSLCRIMSTPSSLGGGGGLQSGRSFICASGHTETYTDTGHWSHGYKVDLCVRHDFELPGRVKRDICVLFPLSRNPLFGTRCCLFSVFQFDTS